MTDRELMQNALDALRDAKGYIYHNVLDGENQYDKAIEALRARLAEPPCKTGSQCIGGKCERCVEPEPAAKMKELLEVQAHDGNWNLDPYMHGMYNGMELMVALVEGRDPVFRKAPEQFIYAAPPQREWQGLTDSERNKIFDMYGYTPVDIVALCRSIEAKLREKNFTGEKQ